MSGEKKNVVTIDNIRKRTFQKKFKILENEVEKNLKKLTNSKKDKTFKKLKKQKKCENNAGKCTNFQ